MFMQTYPTHEGILIRILKTQTEFLPTLNSSADKVENCNRNWMLGTKSKQSRVVFVCVVFLAASITANSPRDSLTLTSDPWAGAEQWS